MLGRGAVSWGSPGEGSEQAHGLSKKKSMWSGGSRKGRLGGQTSPEAELRGGSRRSGEGMARATGRVFGSKSPQTAKSTLSSKPQFQPGGVSPFRAGRGLRTLRGPLLTAARGTALASLGLGALFPRRLAPCRALTHTALAVPRHRHRR